MISAILPPMTVGSATTELHRLRDAVEDELRGFLTDRRAAMVALAERAAAPVDELVRLTEAGGSRLRALCCCLGHRAAGGLDGPPIHRAGAALELLHLMALIHDDLMDRSASRRGVPASHVAFADAARAAGHADPDHAGRALAILAGDLAAVLADQLLLGAGFPTERLAPALARYHEMRLAMAAGQYLDVTAGEAGGLARGNETGPAAGARRLAALKGGSYSVGGPLSIGAILAGGSPQVLAALDRVGGPLGLAFQLRDDLRDGDAAAGVTAAEVEALVAEAKAALEPGALEPVSLEPGAVGALMALADRVGER